ncbi:uncharacterized protein EDB91DRAFT_1335406 [Suillus paluster]|uniref:uncharacterized protein n=1 Tax=Suillus paluster TaxID=48578 RepID=UPI001B87C53D|nr:uncharacterized protein EDB91DRAFT_1335406 [Suillus paluster]KAG1744913.1 hypothetical protein EDB91DRAFT_1335406 [Suillus paluster]
MLWFLTLYPTGMLQALQWFTMSGTRIFLPSGPWVRNQATKNTTRIRERDSGVQQIATTSIEKVLGHASQLPKFGSGFMPHLHWILYSVTENSAQSRPLLESYWIAVENHIVRNPKGEVVSSCTSLFLAVAHYEDDYAVYPITPVSDQCI